VVAFLPGGAPAARAIEPVAAANELIALTNINRTSNGLPALLRDSRLNSLGVARSQDMIDRGYFSHYIPPNNETVIDILQGLGVPFRAAGENIEFNDAVDYTTIAFANTEFMNSPGHRANILSPQWDRVGAGVAQGGQKKMYTVVFLQSVPRAAAPASRAPAPAPQLGAPAAGATPATGGPPPLRPVSPLLASPPPATAPATPGGTGRSVEVRVAQTGLIDSLINRMLRLFLGL
jgi:hypothetical protein